ncbi:hypothetical protein HMPREF9946_03121 [Acetobacteraceae bacterium AT-5844]|nr:hypothetical protein HMPREF9946_03121 [Acetobacteraceae bacterium AT-5844]
MSGEMEMEDGWWVPVTHFWRQEVLPHTGSVQMVGDVKGRIHRALILSGHEGWRDGNYNVIPNVTDWFKPSRFFSSRDDMHGDAEAVRKVRDEASGRLSPLRSATHDRP